VLSGMAHKRISALRRARGAATQFLTNPSIVAAVIDKEKMASGDDAEKELQKMLREAGLEVHSHEAGKVMTASKEGLKYGQLEHVISESR